MDNSRSDVYTGTFANLWKRVNSRMSVSIDAKAAIRHASRNMPTSDWQEALVAMCVHPTLSRFRLLPLGLLSLLILYNKSAAG